MDAVFKALADPGRRELLDQLHARGGQSLNQLCAHLAMTRQAVSQHLALLEAAELVVPVWSGRQKLHYLNPVPLFEISRRWISKYQSRRLAVLAELKAALEQTPKDQAPKEQTNVSAGIRVRQLHRQHTRKTVGRAH